MDKESITGILEEKHIELINWLDNQPEEKWLEGPEGKWTVGQHILHLIKSTPIIE